MPNVLLNLLSDHVVIDTFYPLAPELTRVICDWLFDPDVMTRADFDPVECNLTCTSVAAQSPSLPVTKIGEKSNVT